VRIQRAAALSLALRLLFGIESEYADLRLFIAR